MNTDIFDTLRENCPLCNSPEIHLRYTISRYEMPFKVYSCLFCSFMFINPKFTDIYIKEFYGEGYYRGTGDYTYHDEREIEDFSGYVWESRIRNIRKFVSKGNFLDVGSSFGGLLKTAGKYFSTYGIELSRYAGEYSCSIPGLSVHIGTLDDHPYEQNFFTVITMIELIEHLKDPVKSVKECYRLLEIGGLLLIQTANMDGLQAKFQKERYSYFMPGHLSYFTKKNLTQLLKNAGFRKIIVYHPVDFGLLPKLLKSRHSFRNLPDYRKWFKITWYHILSKLQIGNLAATSSMVIYAFK